MVFPFIPVFPEIFGTAGFNPTDNERISLEHPSMIAATVTFPLEVPTVASIVLMEELPVQSFGRVQV